jgi:hypothetical protein
MSYVDKQDSISFSMFSPPASGLSDEIYSQLKPTFKLVNLQVIEPNESFLTTVSSAKCLRFLTPRLTSLRTTDGWCTAWLAWTRIRGNRESCGKVHFLDSFSLYVWALVCHSIFYWSYFLIQELILYNYFTCTIFYLSPSWLTKLARERNKIEVPKWPA